MICGRRPVNARACSRGASECSRTNDHYTHLLNCAASVRVFFCVECVRACFFFVCVCALASSRQLCNWQHFGVYAVRVDARGVLLRSRADNGCSVDRYPETLGPNQSKRRSQTRPMTATRSFFVWHTRRQLLCLSGGAAHKRVASTVDAGLLTQCPRRISGIRLLVTGLLYYSDARSPARSSRTHALLCRWRTSYLGQAEHNTVEMCCFCIRSAPHCSRLTAERAARRPVGCVPEQESACM